MRAPDAEPTRRAAGPFCGRVHERPQRRRRRPVASPTGGALMARTPTPRRPPLDFTKPMGDDRIMEQAAPTGPWHWGAVLTWFMRLVAILWIAKGLGAWAVILGVWSPTGDFGARTTGFQAVIVYFAVIDLIAATGLWMASTWGGVLWLLALMSHLILAAFFPTFIPSSLLTSGILVALMVLYLAVTWLSAQDE